MTRQGMREALANDPEHRPVAMNSAMSPSWAERVLAQTGWLVAGLILLLWVFSTELTHRLDWMRWGADYEASQQKLSRDASQVLTQFDARLKALEKPATKGEP